MKSGKMWVGICKTRYPPRIILVCGRAEGERAIGTTFRKYRAREEFLLENELIKLHKKRYQFHIMRELQQIEALDNTLPTDEVRKYISRDGFSSIGFIKFISERAHINSLVVSTLRVGRKHLQVLDVLHSQTKIDDITFIVGSIMKQDSALGKSYKYYDDLSAVCKKNDWRVIVHNNHSEVLLFDTDCGKYVIETSSNLNENPNMEQFSFERNAELYKFYKNAFAEILEVKT
jgi:hypothetical protein